MAYKLWKLWGTAVDVAGRRRVVVVVCLFVYVLAFSSSLASVEFVGQRFEGGPVISTGSAWIHPWARVVRRGINV